MQTYVEESKAKHQNLSTKLLSDTLEYTKTFKCDIPQIILPLPGVMEGK